MKHPKTDELRKKWTEYVQEINRMRWNISPTHPDHSRFTKAFTTLMQIAQTIKSTGEIEEGDTVTNGTETFVVMKVESDRVYKAESEFFHAETLRIKRKFDEALTEAV